MNELRLQYQKDTGITADRLTREIDGIKSSSTYISLYDYIHWLEEKLEHQ